MPEQEQPIQAELREHMNLLAHFLDEQFNGQLQGDDKKWGFALLVFPFGSGDDHRSNYISNTRREDMLAAMREFIARNEGRYEFDPTRRTT